MNRLAPTILLLFFLLTSCGEKKPTIYHLKLKGSESLNETFLALKYGFEQLQDTVKLHIEGGGSRTGLIAIKEGSADIGLSSYKFDLDAMLGQNHQVSEMIVAYDGIVVVNNKKNPITSLTNEEVKRIFNGEINNWSQIGGADGQIVRIIRDGNSGTQKFFQNHFQIDKVVKNAIIEEDNKHIVKGVLDNVNAIGFISFSYFAEQINSIKLQSSTDESANIQFIEPAFKTLESGQYPLRRSLQIYYRTDNQVLSSFLEYLKTKEAKSIIEMHGMLAKVDITKALVVDALP